MNQQGYEEKHQNIDHSTQPINLTVEQSYPKFISSIFECNTVWMVCGD
jgi:hypothetical protein